MNEEDLEIRITSQMRFDKLMDGVKGNMQAEGHPILDTKYTSICKTLLDITEAKKIMEIGFNAGHTCFAFLDCNEDVEVHSIDINRHNHTLECASRLRKMFGSRFQFGEMDSMDMGINSLEGYDLVRIDGGHEISVLKNDWECCKASKVPWVVIDDINFPDIRGFVRHILESDNHPYVANSRQVYNNCENDYTHQVLLERVWVEGDELPK